MLESAPAWWLRFSCSAARENVCSASRSSRMCPMPQPASANVAASPSTRPQLFARISASSACKPPAQLEPQLVPGPRFAFPDARHRLVKERLDLLQDVLAL